MKRLIPILLACLCLTACNWQSTKTGIHDSLNWETTIDTISLSDQIEPSLHSGVNINSVTEANNNIYFCADIYTRLERYGDPCKYYEFCISPNGKISHAGKHREILAGDEWKIPLADILEWDISLLDLGEWGNYLSFSRKSREYLFYQHGSLRALFLQGSTFVSVSKSTIARITNPASGSLMTQPKTGNAQKDEILYYKYEASEQDILWRTDGFKIRTGEADTVIHGAYMIDDKLMVAMRIHQSTGIYSFDGKNFQLEYDLGALSLEDDYTTLQNQLSCPECLLLPFKDKDRHGILRIKGKTVHLIYILIPERYLSVSSTDPTISLVNALADISGLTLTQADSIERVYGGLATDNFQYYTLLPDSSYLLRAYIVNDSTGLIKVFMSRHELKSSWPNKDWHEWQNDILDAFWDEISPVVSSGKYFVVYESRRFLMHLEVGGNHHRMIIVFSNNKTNTP